MTPTVGDRLVQALFRLGVRNSFGVLSIHNMPLLDALGRDGRIRFVCSRGEAGAVGMADACARVSGALSVAFTSTGTGAGNAAGALVEAWTAGTPMLHITGQVSVPYLDRGRFYVHEAKDQLSMLQACSKAAFRVWSAETALSTLYEAARVALTPPTGPVSIEIPIDLQGAPLDIESPFAPPRIVPLAPDEAALDRVADALAGHRRPILWAGGGAKHAKQEIRALVDMGFAVVTSIQGRGIVPEDDPRGLAAFNSQPAIEQFYGTCDALLVVGSRLRVPETLSHQLELPPAIYQLDCDPEAFNRSYPMRDFVLGDTKLALAGLIRRLKGRLKLDPALQKDAAAARAQAEKTVRAAWKPYDGVSDALQKVVGRDFNWVRDVTIANATWGNRLFQLFDTGQGVHASGGGIGQGLVMGVGAAVGAPQRKTWVLSGDGGFMLNMGELATAVQEKTGLVLLMMNDGGYGILRNLQDADFEGRRYYADLHGPNFEWLAKSLGTGFHKVTRLDGLEGILRAAKDDAAPTTIVEFDLRAIGPSARPFTGPPLGRG